MKADIVSIFDYERRPSRPRTDNSAEGELSAQIIVLPIIRIDRDPNGSDLVRVVGGTPPHEWPFR